MDSYDGRKKKDNKKKKTFEKYGKNTSRGLRIKEEKKKEGSNQKSEKNTKENS